MRVDTKMAEEDRDVPVDTAIEEMGHQHPFDRTETNQNTAHVAGIHLLQTAQHMAQGELPLDTTGLELLGGHAEIAFSLKVDRKTTQEWLEDVAETEENEAVLAEMKIGFPSPRGEDKKTEKSMVEVYKAKTLELERRNAILETRVNEAERKCRGAEAHLADVSPKYGDAVKELQKKELKVKNLMEDLAGTQVGLRKKEMELIELTHNHGVLLEQHAQLAAKHEEATAALEVKTAGATELRELLYEAAHNLAIQLEPLQQVGARHCTGMLCTYFVVLWQ